MNAICKAAYQNAYRIRLNTATLARKCNWILMNWSEGFLGSLVFPGDSDGKEPACNVGDLGSIPGLGKSPRGGNGNPLQYSGLENFMDREPTGLQSMVSQSWTRLSDFHFTGSSVGKESACNSGEPGFIPGREDPLEKKMPGKFHGQRSLASYSPWRCKSQTQWSWNPNKSLLLRESV